MKGCILIAITFCLFGCSKEDVNPTADNTVHLAGYVMNSNIDGDGDGVASYWKDNVYTGLTGDGIISRVSSMYVDGSSVLIGGTTRTTHSFPISVMWRDGAETSIEEAVGEPMVALRNNNLFGVWLVTSGEGWVFHKNGITQPIVDTAYNFAPMAMTLLGDDVYTSGYSSGPPLPRNYFAPQHAQYWKNGQLIFSEKEVSNALSIFTHKNDIYMAGHLYGDTFSIACYWKNGKRVNLTDSSVTSIASSIFVTDTHVYAAGMIDDQAVYWKDGEAIFLTIEGTYSMANSIFVHGADVHVAGFEHGHPSYWKNDVRQDIVNQDKLGQIKFVVVGSN